MLEIETITNTKKPKDLSLNVDDIVQQSIKRSPSLDKRRGDLVRGNSYYLTGGDPDNRNQI